MNKLLELCEKTGIDRPEIVRIKGDMSNRRIFRIFYGGGSVIGIRGDDPAENGAFLSFRDSFEEAGLAVPAFIAASEDLTAYILEDLGDVTVKRYCDGMIEAGRLPEIKSVYSGLMRTLPVIQNGLYNKIDYSKCYQGEVFDREAMEKDTGRFEDYFLKKYHKRYDPEKFMRFRKEVVGAASDQSTEFFMYRDFQTRNVMMKNGKFYFIDFQSGRKGPYFYDAASMIYSSGTVRYEGMEDDMSEAYCSGSDHVKMSREDFVGILRLFGCLRIMQALGNYAYYYYERSAPPPEYKKGTGLSELNGLSLSLGFDNGIMQGTCP